MNRTTDLFHAPVTLNRAAPFGKPSRADLERINTIAARELRADEVFMLSGTPSTNARDAYFTYMHDSSFRRFVRDLNSGSAFLDSHDSSRLPIGASFYGAIEDIPEGKAEGVEANRRIDAKWYMLRNHNVPGSGNTNDYIAGIEAGVIGNLSIGFGGPDMRIICDEDGRDLNDYESPYYPGQILEDGRTVLYAVHDANIYETSAVYKNATPGALIDRWQELINDRRIPAKDIERLSRVTHHRFDVAAFGSYPTYPANRPEDAETGLIFRRDTRPPAYPANRLEDEFSREGLTLNRPNAPIHTDPVGASPFHREGLTPVRDGRSGARSYDYEPWYDDLEDAPDDETAREGLSFHGGNHGATTGDEADTARQLRAEGLTLIR